MYKLALTCCLLFVLAAVALESSKSCLELKVKCVKNGFCKKKYKEYKKKCSFADASCLGDEDHRQRCELLSNILLDATVFGVRGRSCDCDKHHVDKGDLIKCRMVYNLLHANPCTVYIPPTPKEPSFFSKLTTETTARQTTTTTTVKATAEAATTAAKTRVEPTTNEEVVNLHSTPLCSSGMGCEKLSILSEDKEETGVQRSKVVEQKSEENVALSFITPILIACLSLFVVIVLTAFIIIKVHFSPVSANRSRSSSGKRDSALFNFSSTTATTGTGAKTRSEGSDLLAAVDQDFIRVPRPIDDDDDDDDDFRQTV